MPEEDYDFTPASRLMQPHEIEQIAAEFVKLGVTKIRLTGGEPLVRKDAADIIMRLSKFPITLTLTTNATRLHQFIDVLQAANVNSLNISLDTLNADKFLLISRRNEFQTVYNNIKTCIEKGFHVKINVVVMKGLNDGEINDFIEWTKNDSVHIRFIEFMPFTGNKWSSNKVVTYNEILEKINESYSFLPLVNEKNDTAKSFIIPGHKGTFSVISTMSTPFCSSCNRIRLTADGKFKNCLFSEGEVDILSAFRKGDDIVPLITQSITSKAEMLGGQFTSDFINIQAEDIHNRSMISIGG